MSRTAERYREALVALRYAEDARGHFVARVWVKRAADALRPVAHRLAETLDHRLERTIGHPRIDDVIKIVEGKKWILEENER